MNLEELNDHRGSHNKTKDVNESDGWGRKTGVGGRQRSVHRAVEQPFLLSQNSPFLLQNSAL